MWGRAVVSSAVTGVPPLYFSGDMAWDARQAGVLGPCGDDFTAPRLEIFHWATPDMEYSPPVLL